LLGEQELRRVLIRLDAYGIQPLLLKGVPLAYTLYRSPVLRPRNDTDILIRESDLNEVVRVLRQLGYDGPDIQHDKLASYECLYTKKTSVGKNYYLDVHWKLNNAHLFANTFTFDELLSEALKIPQLASCALGLGSTHALLLACMHRFAHAHAPFYVGRREVYAGDHLRWVYDIHLLCSAMSNDRWLEFTSLATKKRIAEFCVDGLHSATETFNTKIPVKSMGALESAACDEVASAKRLRGSEVRWFVANLRALPDLRQQISFIKQVAFPRSAYMVEKYHSNNPFALPFLYGHRAVNAIVKRVRRPKSRY
jgi:hypothetical protein